MKRKMLSFLLLAAVAAVACGQQVFTAKCPTGQVLSFRPLADSVSVEVVGQQRQWPYYGEAKPTGRLVLPERVGNGGRQYSVVGVGTNAFYRCDGLTAVVLPVACRYVGAQAFNGCVSLTEVSLGDSLALVDEGAFAYCSSLRAVALPPSVRRVGISAFAMCRALAEVSMSEVAWRSCNGLTFLGCETLGEGKKATKQADGSVILRR